MNTRPGLLIVLASLGLACSSDKGGQEQQKQSAAPAASQPASTNPSGESAAAAGEQRPPAADMQKPPAAETPVPKKTIELDTLDSGKPLEIDVPTDFEIDRATPDFVALQGSFRLTVEVPAEGLVSLDDEHELVAGGKADLVLEEKLEDGDAISYRADGKTYTTVSRPKLGVLCSTTSVIGADDARKVFEICKTLRHTRTP